MNEGNSRGSTVEFKYHGRASKIVVMVLLGLASGIFGCVGYIEDGRTQYGWPLFMLGGCVFLLFFAAFLVAFSEDILVGPSGVSRMLFKKTTRHIVWRDVREIRTTLTRASDSRKIVHGYWIHTKKENRFGSNCSRIGFSDYEADLTEVISVMEGYVRDGHIPVVHIRAQGKIRTDSLYLEADKKYE